MKLLRITGFFSEREEFVRTGQWIEVWLMEARLQSETFQANDGRKTVSATNGHFDFYEYENCDLNTTFQITKSLIEEKNDERN